MLLVVNASHRLEGDLLEEEALTSLHVRQAAEGDPASLAWIVRRFSPLLLAQARYRLGPSLARRVDAEDLVQDVWVRVLPKLAGLEPNDDRLTPVVAKFLSVTLLRRIKDLLHKHDLGEPDARPSSAANTEENETIDCATDESGVVTRAMREEEAESLVTLIAGLEENDRAIVVLRGIEQRSNQEAAKLLGLTADTASARYRRALAKLKDCMPSGLLADA